MRTAMVLGALGLGLATGCAAAPEPRRDPAPSLPGIPTPAHWQTTLDVGHPLVGKVWDARHHRFAGPDDVWAALAEANFVVLGEKHDNPDHHALQARALQEIVRRGKKPAVAFEMLDSDQQPAIDAFLAKPGATVEGFGQVSAWEKRGWYTYAWYAPIIQVAIAGQLPIVAANLPHAQMHALVHQGLAALGPEETHRLGLDVPLPEAQAAEVRQEMRDAHCGKLPESMVEPMALAQRARDAHLAAAMIAAAQGREVVLVAGDGHARTDRGVPDFLYRRAPSGSRVVSVAFREVEAGETEPPPEPFDFVWFTPRATDEDPCEGMASPKK